MLQTKGLLILLFSCVVGAADIKFYDSLNYTGLFYEVKTTPAECNSLPEYGHNMTVSLITDTCIILHEDVGCKSFNAIKLPKGSHDDLKNRGFGNSFKAFEVCSTTNGGAGLNVDLFYTSGYKDLAVKYNDVCGCIDMPNYVGVRQILSVQNHGNCVKLFEEQGCTGKQIEIPGGLNSMTSNLALYFGVPTRSISSCDDHFACLQLHARVIKFELWSNQSLASALSNSMNFELAATTSFRNNGSAIVTQEYHATKKIVESVEIFRSKSLSTMTRVETVNELEWKVSADLSFGPFSSSANLRNKFVESHKMEKNSSSEESERYVSEQEREFSVSQTIQIMPCTVYEVKSLVKLLENYPVNYVVHMKVSGTYSGLQLTTSQIKDRLIDIEYMDDEDQFTVIGKSEGTMITDFGVETVIEAEGFPLENCSK